MGKSSWSALSNTTKAMYNQLVAKGEAIFYPRLTNPVTVDGETTIIHCYRKGELHKAYIDTEDLPKIALGYAVSLVVKSANETPYCRIGCNGIDIHRLVTKCPEGMVVDHINHNTMDNRKANLRIMSHEENMVYKKRYGTNITGTKNIVRKNGYYCLHISRTFANRQYAERALKEIYDIIQHYSVLDARLKAEIRMNGTE